MNLTGKRSVLIPLLYLPLFIMALLLMLLAPLATVDGRSVHSSTGPIRGRALSNDGGGDVAALASWTSELGAHRVAGGRQWPIQLLVFRIAQGTHDGGEPACGSDPGNQSGTQVVDT